MPYSLDAKIIAYVTSAGIPGATIEDGVLIIGTSHHPIGGFVTKQKLDRIIEEHKAQEDATQS